MALKKQIETESGVVTTYHRIEAIHSIQRNGAVEMYMGEYLTEEDRRAGKNPVRRVRHNITLDPEALDTIIASAYGDQSIKSGPYEEAADIIDEEATK